MQMISMPRPSAKAGAPACGLFIRMPNETFGIPLLEKLRAVSKALNASDYEKNCHMMVYDAEKGDFTAEDIGLIGQFLRSQGIVFLVSGSIGPYEHVDGYMHATTDAYNRAASSATQSDIIGYRATDCDSSAVLDIVIKGVDVVCIPFSKTQDTHAVADLIACIKNTSETVCVIEHDGADYSVRDAVRAGVTFVDASAVWQQENHGAFITAMLDAIENAADNSAAH